MKLVNNIVEIAIGIFLVWHWKDVALAVHWLMTVKISA
jgi:hypothetical protein